MENQRTVSMQDEKFHVKKSQIWREPDVSQLWKEHLTHMKRQQKQETELISTGEESELESDADDDGGAKEKGVQIGRCHCKWYH